MIKLSLSTFDDIEIFTKAAAPISHRRHVLDMGRAPSSFAPSEHQKHLLELAGHTSSPAPWSHLTPGRSPTYSQFGLHNKRPTSNVTVSQTPYDSLLLSPTPRVGLKGNSSTPSPVPSTEGQGYESNLPQQILTPREVPFVDRVSPKPNRTNERKQIDRHQPREGSASPKAPKKKKKQSKNLHTDGSSTQRSSSQSSPFRTPIAVRLSGVQNEEVQA